MNFIVSNNSLNFDSTDLDAHITWFAQITPFQ